MDLFSVFTFTNRIANPYLVSACVPQRRISCSNGCLVTFLQDGNTIHLAKDNSNFVEKLPKNILGVFRVCSFDIWIFSS